VVGTAFAIPVSGLVISSLMKMLPQVVSL